MKIKCRGYDGDLIYLDEIDEKYHTTLGGEHKKTAFYTIQIRAKDLAKIELNAVTEDEIEIILEGEKDKGGL